MEFKKVMADTSVWIDFFKIGDSEASHEMATLIENDLLCICGVIEMELIHGLRKKERLEVLSVIDIIEFIELSREDYRIAGNVLNSLRTKGVTIPPTDALIAANCIGNNLKLISFDKHYRHFNDLDKKLFRK